MAPQHKVRTGDCIDSIAFESGYLPDTIWQHPDNAALRSRRKDPNLLREGDVVNIPEKQKGTESGATEQRHRFKRKGVPAKIRLVLLDDDNEPRANEEFTLTIDGKSREGRTDGDGALEVPISPGARSGTLLLGPERDEVFELDIGHTDPIDDTSGVQQRLRNLGYDVGAIDEHVGPRTEAALRAFQRDNGLEESGTLDEATRQKLEAVHES